MNLLRIGVVGSRSRNISEDKKLIKDAIIYLKNKDKNIIVSLVSGGAKAGADKFAEEIAQELNLSISIHNPDKSKMVTETKYEYIKQLFERNTLIANECDILLCTWDGESSGTYDTIKKCLSLNKPVVYL